MLYDMNKKTYALSRFFLDRVCIYVILSKVKLLVKLSTTKYKEKEKRLFKNDSKNPFNSYGF